MIILEEKKIIFVSIPKTGSTSIMTVLDPTSLTQKPDLYHQSINEFFINNSYSKYSDYNFNYVIRCPVTRLISFYFDSIDTDHLHSEAIRNYKSFDHFCLSLTKESKKIRHLFPQNYFYEYKHKLNKNFFYFEDFGKIINYFSLVNNVETFPHFRKSKYNLTQIIESLSYRSFFIIMKVYFRDYLSFSKYFLNFFYYLKLKLRKQIKSFINFIFNNKSISNSKKN